MVVFFLYISFLTSMYRSINKMYKDDKYLLLGRNQLWLAQMWAVGGRAGLGGLRVWRQRSSSQRLSRAAPVRAHLSCSGWPDIWPVRGDLEWTSGAAVFPLSDSVLWEITRWLTNTSTTPPPQTTSASTTTAGGGPLRGPSHIPGAHTGQYLISCMWISESALSNIGVSTGVDNPLVPHWRAILAWYCDQGELW